MTTACLASNPGCPGNSGIGGPVRRSQAEQPQRQHERRRGLFLPIVLLLCAALSPDARSQTVVSGTISSNTNWTLAGSPFVLDGDVIIAAGVILTVDPGVVVKGADVYHELRIIGTLVADGTGAMPIIFTSLKDDTAGGDTNGDGGLTTPAAGDWTGIGFDDLSTGNLLDFVAVRYAGGANHIGVTPNESNVYTETSDLTVSNSVIADGADDGIRLKATAETPQIVDTVIERNAGVAVYLSHINSTRANLEGTVATDNGTNGVSTAGTLTQSAIWSDDLPYVLINDANVASGVTLTLEPGAVVKGAEFHHELRIIGTLMADGTGAMPIIFTSLKDDTAGGDTNGDEAGTLPAPGDWTGIGFDNLSTGNLLNFVEVRYGGGADHTGGSSNASNVYMETSDLTLSNSVISDGADAGIFLYLSSGATLSGNTIRNNVDGIQATGSSVAQITDNWITENQSYAIFFGDAASSASSLQGNTVENNEFDGARVGVGTIGQSAVWSDDTPYVLAGGDVTIDSGVTLTVEPGAVVKGADVYHELRIIGTLMADGFPVSAAFPRAIHFTSLQDDSVGGDTNGDGAATLPAPGDWAGIGFDDLSTGNLLNFVAVRYAGGQDHYGGSGNQSNVYIKTSDLTMSNSLIAHGSSRGVLLTGSGASLANNTIRDNNVGIRAISGSTAGVIDNTVVDSTVDGMQAGSSSGLTVTGNTLSGSGTNGFNNESGMSAVVTATNNYWGHSSGPFDPVSNPLGLGDGVSVGVTYSPWLGICQDRDADGFCDTAGDCNDALASAFPGAVEVCDGWDSDCDGSIDEGCDRTRPLCSGDPFNDGVDGTATDLAPDDTGIFDVSLAPGATNVSLSVDPFTPGDSTVTFRATPTSLSLDGFGVVVVTDGVDGTCSLPVVFEVLVAGPVTDEPVCAGEGVSMTVTGEATSSGVSTCSTNLPPPTDPVLPAGYEPLPPDVPNPCQTMTIDSTISGDTDMVYTKQGPFDPRLRLLISTFDGFEFTAFQDVTLSVEPTASTRLKGRGGWSQVKVICALQSEICNGLDDDGDGLVDEDLPVGEPGVDVDGDGFSLCPAAGNPLDCNDQLASVNPLATEVCNGFDDNCDGLVDEGDPGGGAACVVAGQMGVCALGLEQCLDGAVRCVQTIFPTTEACDGLDNNCDGSTDEDTDTDGFDACSDCDNGNMDAWALPDAVQYLTFAADGQSLSWTAPASLGGTSVGYDTLRSSTASDFLGAAACVESDGGDMSSTDATVPSAGAALYYLVGAENFCGAGSLGTDSGLTPREARACP